MRVRRVLGVGAKEGVEVCVGQVGVEGVLEREEQLAKHRQRDGRVEVRQCANQRHGHQLHLQR